MQEVNYNIDNLVEFAAGDKNFIKEMLEFFVSDSPEVLMNLKNAASNIDYENIYQISHKFSSQLSLVEINEVASLMNEIEKKAFAKEGIDEIRNKIDISIDIILAAISRIKKDFKI